MFKFLFRKAEAEVEVVKETQRETVERALAEVNEVLGVMTVRSKIAVNLETGMIEIELPEQMPDEALALPKPEDKQEAEAASDVEKTTEAEAKPEVEEAPEAKSAA